MTYKFAQLTPCRLPYASSINEPILRQDCLGVEVTEPELAAKCVLGNIDPQHSESRCDLSAIVAACDWHLPDDGATLVTIRLDADALGAMAVLQLRANGISLSDEAHERISLIDAADRFANGSWSGVRPLPTRLDELDEISPGPQSVGAIIRLAADREISLSGKIHAIADWILTGRVSEDARRNCSAAASALLTALSTGAVRVQDLIPGVLSYVAGSFPGALRLGYRRAPLVLAGPPSGQSNSPRNSQSQGARKIRVFTAFSFSPRLASAPATIVRALSVAFRLSQRQTKSSAYLTARILDADRILSMGCR
jgi:hypothetical protein